MQKTNEILELKKHYQIIPILGLILLLLVSPCKVRNFIQAELGVPQTKVLNKSQTTLSTDSCDTVDDVNINIASQSVGKSLDSFVVEKLLTLQFPSQLTYKNTYPISRSKLISSLPLYLLYQKIQVYA